MSEIAVKAEGLSVKLEGNTILDDLSFSLPAGAFLSIIGPNGAGKTTLLKSILGFIPAFEGRLEIYGRTPDKLDPGMIGYVPQVKMLDRSFPGQALELVVSGLRRKWPGIVKSSERDKAVAALESIGAAGIAERQINRLSGGELQRVYLARAIISSPRMVILDEPATGIDAVGEEDMYMLLERYQHKSGASILMITHDLNAVCHLCSHVLLLNRRLIGFGTPQESLSEDKLRLAFGHVGHNHAMLSFGKEHHD